MAARRSVGFVLGAGLGMLIALPARAQEAASPESGTFGGDRPFVLTFENLGGFAYTRVKPEDGDTTSNYQAGMFAVGALGGLGEIAGLGGPMGRVGLHYFVAPSVSLGLLLGYADNDTFGSVWSTGARVGYALPMTGRNAVWLRAGVAYTHTKIDSFGGDVTFTNVAPGGEVLFVIEPVEGFGVMLGPMFEYGFAKVESKVDFMGSSKTSSEKYKVLQLGLTFGILADF